MNQGFRELNSATFKNEQFIQETFIKSIRESDWKYFGVSFKRAYNIKYTVGTFFKICQVKKMVLRNTYKSEIVSKGS